MKDDDDIGSRRPPRLHGNPTDSCYYVASTRVRGRAARARRRVAISSVLSADRRSCVFWRVREGGVNVCGNTRHAVYIWH